VIALHDLEIVPATIRTMLSGWRALGLGNIPHLLKSNLIAVLLWRKRNALSQVDQDGFSKKRENLKREEKKRQTHLTFNKG
jgi:hypothetical protein